MSMFMNSRLSFVLSVSYDTSSSSLNSSVISTASVVFYRARISSSSSRIHVSIVRVSIRLSKKCATLLYSSWTVANADIYDCTISLYTGVPRRAEIYRYFVLGLASRSTASIYPWRPIYMCVYPKEREREKDHTIAYFIPTRSKTRRTPRLPRGKLVKL